MGWLSSFFYNPAFVTAATALISVPIIIHLINRMRFRRVRFAAMEFLLLSQQKNRRRVLIEQLLLLLMRILIVALLGMLIARLILDPSQASMFRTSKTHHVVLLDDSSSMRDRWGNTSAFQEACEVVVQLVEQGARRPGQQKLTVILVSDYEKQLFEQRDINEEFVDEVKLKLKSLECTHRSLSLLDAFENTRQYLASDKATVKRLHVISDFRNQEWIKQKALTETIQEVDDEGVHINLIKTVPEKHNNLAITDFDGDVHIANAGEPLALNLEVTNFTAEVVKNLTVQLFVDEKPVSVILVDRIEENLVFKEVKPGEPISLTFGVQITRPGWHHLRAEIPDDSLLADNARFLTVNVKTANDVLIIDGNPAVGAGNYVRDALLGAEEDKGLNPIIKTVDTLRKEDLSRYTCIYMLNVGKVPSDAIKPLEEFTANGGGLAWYLGDSISPRDYNLDLYNGGKGVFPVPLAAAPRTLAHPNLEDNPNAVDPGPDLVLEEHPIFRIFTATAEDGSDNPFITLLTLNRWLPVADKLTVDGKEMKWEPNDNERNDGVITIAKLRTGEPLMFEHTFGKGRVITCLSTAGDAWNDWCLNAPLFLITQLELQNYIANKVGARKQFLVGDPILEIIDPTRYSETLSILAPLQKRALTVQATPYVDEVLKGAKEENQDNKPDAPKSEDLKRSAIQYTETDRPGIYLVSKTSLDSQQNVESIELAYNVNTDQSDLTLAETDELNELLGKESKVQILEAGDSSWLEAQDADQDVRNLILIALITLLVLEQLLAYRLSFHTRGT